MITATEIILPIIRHFEGLRLVAYKCPAGVWTIGYGSTGPGIGPGVVWTLQQAEDRMRFSVAYFLQIALKLSPILLQFPHAHAGVTDFIYNLGASRYKSSTFKKRIDSRDFLNAAIECKKWVYGGGRVLSGLVLRREVDARLISQCIEAERAA